MENLGNFNIEKNPFDTFKTWHDRALKSEINADAFSFATSDKNGNTSLRYLLYKGFHENQFKIFGSSYSQKAKQLSENNKAAMAFFWPSEMLQVRIEGTTTPMPSEMVENYFCSRPYESQVASYISKQSTPLESRDVMLEQFNSLIDQKQELNLPDFWQGWLLKPNLFEFFIYREHRLNDRFRFTLNSQGEFDIQRVWP